MIVKGACYYTGTIHNGGVICDKLTSEARITTDKSVVSCIDCLKILGAKIHTGRHVHLNYNFLDFIDVKGELLEFINYEKTKDFKTICSKEPKKNEIKKVTNNPLEVTCQNCRKNKWGNHDNKTFILLGVLVEKGLSMREAKLMSKLSPRDLEKRLDFLLHGGKI